MHGGSALQHPYPTQSPAPSTLPDDFSDRLVRFKAASGLSWRALGKELGVNPYRLREWRRGVTPSTPAPHSPTRASGTAGVGGGVGKATDQRVRGAASYW